MIIFRIIHTFLFALYTLLAFFSAVLMLRLFSIFASNKSRYFHRTSKIWCRYFILPVLGVKVKIEGLENIPKEPVIFMSNHQSYLDIPLLLAYLPGTFHFIAKQELFRIPFLGWYIKAAGHISIDREMGISAHKTLEKAAEVLKRGESIIVFPDGTRSPDGNLQNFRRGSLMLAFKAEVPLVPLAIRGSFKVLPRGSLLIYPAKVEIKIGKSVLIQEYKGLGKKGYEEAIKKMRDEIINLLKRP